MNGLSVSACFWDYDRTKALLDGRVRIQGVQPSFTVLNPVETFARASARAEFDVTELSLSHHITAVAAGSSAYAGIPVFLSRTFRHSILFVRSDKGIYSPSDLKGKVIGLPDYKMTAAVVVRGLLREKYGVAPDQISWRVGPLGKQDGTNAAVSTVPGVDIKPLTDRTLDSALAQGMLDGLISVHEPLCFREGHPHVRRLFADWRRVEQEYAASTGIFPIMHLVGIRKDILRTNSWLARAVYEAFEEAKQIAVDELSITQAPKITLPWVTAELQTTKAVLGEDFWPYGIRKNRKALDAMLRYSADEGLSSRHLTVEELFAEETHDL